MARALANPVTLNAPERGVDGRTILAKARAPLASDGRIGDFWIDTVTKKLWGPKNAGGWPDNGLIKGDKGWTPVFGVVSDGLRRVQRVVDWQGGEGIKPATGQYVGATGLVDEIEDAVDIRGVAGPEMAIAELADAPAALTDDSLVPTAETGDDNVKRAAAEIFDLGGVLERKSKAHAEASTVSKEIKRIRTQFYAPIYADLSTLHGGHTFTRANEEPEHDLKFRTLDRWTAEGAHDSANGGWWEGVKDGTNDPARFGGRPVAEWNSGEAIEKDLAFCRDADSYTLPAGIWATDRTLKVNQHRITFRSIGQIVPYGGFSDFLILFIEETPGGDTINVGQMLNLESLNLDCMGQSRGARFARQYCSARKNVHIVRPYGKGLDLDEGYECAWYGVTINLGRNRQRFDDDHIPAAWSSATAYQVGDLVTYHHAAYDAGTTYAAAALVRHGGKSWISIRGGNLGNEPGASLMWFQVDDDYFECVQAHSSKSPYSNDPVYTTNSGVPANRYWKYVLRDEPVLNIEHTYADGVVDHQYFYGLDIRDNGCRNLVYVDNNGNSREVYAIEFHGAQVHATIPGIVNNERNTWGMAMPVRQRNVILGRTNDCKFFGGSFRTDKIDDSVSLVYGLNPPAKTSRGCYHVGRLDGEGARSAAILTGAAQHLVAASDHFFDPYFVMAGVNAYKAVDPYNIIRRNVKVPVVAENLGSYGTTLRKSGAQTIAHDTETALSWDVVDADVLGLFSAGDPTRITANFRGALKITVNVTCAINAEGYRMLRLFKNGTPTILRGIEVCQASAGDAVGNRINASSGAISVDPGDILELRFKHDAGAGLDIVGGASTWMQVDRFL